MTSKITLQDAPDKMREMMEAWGGLLQLIFMTKSQDVARAYQAACTPDIYLFDAALACVYRGRLDGSTPKNDVPLSGQDLRAALDNLLAGQPIDPKQMPSMGCIVNGRKDELPFL